MDCLQEVLPSIGSIASGLLFGVAWLLWIDSVVFARTEYDQGVNGVYWLPGIFQTIALLMVNLINWGLLTGDSLLGGMDGGNGRAKCWVFVAFVFAFSGLIGAIWIFVQELNQPSWEEGSVGPAWNGLLQNLFIFASSLIFRLCRIRSE